MEDLKVLVLDDEPGYLSELSGFFLDMGYVSYNAETPSQAFEILKNNDIDIAIVDIFLPEMNGVEVIEKIKKQYPDISSIAITAHGDMRTVIDCLRAGAADFLNKPFGLQELQKVVKRTGNFARLQEQLRSTELNYKHAQSLLKEKLPVEIICVSAAMKKVINMAAKVAQSNSTSVLITGESGTGKELVARSVHTLSSRKNNFFHCVNCSAIPETLFESEFFGYKKGAFTGASESTSGWFEVSHHGTLFLDEIAELPLSLQAKFLRVLDDKVISKIGTKKGISLDLRIIAATNKDLSTRVEKNEFRDDLYHRLNSFPIHIPPLRERHEDIPELINYFVKMFSKELGKKITMIDDNIYHTLSEYSFPGNVRELKNMIERAMIICDEGVLKIKHFAPGKTKHKKPLHAIQPNQKLDLHKLEQQAITEALKISRFNKSKAAELLNITRQALDRKIKKHNIQNN